MTTLPDGWTSTTLSQIVQPDATIIYGILQPGPHVADGVPYVRPTEIVDDVIDVAVLRRTSVAIAERYQRASLKVDDILLSIVGTIGKVAIVPPDLEGGNITQSSCRIRPDPALTLPAYVAAFLRSPIAVEQYREARLGTAVPRLNLEDVREISIPLPPLAEQRRIVAKLDEVMSRTARARAELARIPALIAQHKRAILAAASAGDLTADFRAKSKLKKWTPTNVERSATVVFDGPFGSHLKSDDYSETGVRVVRLENIGHLRFIEDKRTYVPPEKYASLTRHSLYAGDVVFSSFVDEEVRVCVLPADIDQPTINKADCFCVRTDSAKCDAEFLAYRLACHSTYEALEDAVHGATRPRISLKQLRAFEFDLPSLPEQHEIVRRIKSAFAWLDKVAHEHAQATRLLDHLDQALLAKAFRGELVPQDPADEPAAKLLARIRTEREGAAPAPRKRKARA